MTMHRNKVAVLGASSHIAKGLIANFIKMSTCQLFLYTRDSQKVHRFLDSTNVTCFDLIIIKDSYESFLTQEYDVIINCVGAGTPNVLKNNYSNWFMLTEKYDNLVLEYLRNNPETLYINFSSGACYGSKRSRPSREKSCNRIPVNNLNISDFYSITNLNSEAKHRSFRDLNIIDLRIFSYFSRFIDLDSGYFISELMKAILEKKVFRTNNVNIIRDYIHPEDLFALILKCIEIGKINSAFDCFSLKPVRKWDILEHFTKEYGLQYEIEESLHPSSPNGTNNIYYSRFQKASELGYKPEYSSIGTIIDEASSLLNKEDAHSQIFNCFRDDP